MVCVAKVGGAKLPVEAKWQVGQPGTCAVDWVMQTVLRSWDFILYPVEVFFHEKEKSI